MLVEFLFSLPIILFSIFGLIQVTDLGTQISTANLASFYASRGQFVDLQNKKLAQKAVQELLPREKFNYQIKFSKPTVQIHLTLSPFFPDPFELFSSFRPSIDVSTLLPTRGSQ